MRTLLHVYKKEVRDMFRDKRVRSSALFGPIFVIFLMVSLIGFISKTVKETKTEKLHIVKSNSSALSALNLDKFSVVEVSTVAEGEQLIRDGKARLVLDFQPQTDANQIVIKALIDPKEQRSQITLAALQKLIDAQNKTKLNALLASKGLPSSAAEPIKLQEQDVQVGAAGGASEFLVGILPYLIVIWAFYGGMSIAGDLVAGEKEKNTLETLLISPARRTQIVLGKFLALSTVCLISSLSSLVGLALISKMHMPGTEEILKNGLGVTPAAFSVTLAVLIPLVALFASVLLAVSSFARNPREAQTYLSLCSFVVIMPAMFSQFIGLTDAGKQLWINAVPILNSANAIRSALLGKVDPVAVLITVTVSLVLALIALRITVHLFNREEVLVRV